MKTFPQKSIDLDSNTRESLVRCLKKPIPIMAARINEPFRVQSMEGDYAQGKPGDYLMRGVKGELYICDKEVFESSYDFVVDEGK